MTHQPQPALQLTEQAIRELHGQRRFPPEYEAAYHDDWGRRMRTIGWIMTLTVTAVELLLLALDYISFPRTYQAAWVVRGITVALVLLVGMLMFGRAPSSRLTFTAPIMSVITSAGVLAAVLLGYADEPGTRLYTFGLLVTLLPQFLFSSSLLLPTAVAALTIAAQQVVAIGYQGVLQPGSPIFFEYLGTSVLLAAVLVLGISMGYLFNRINRSNFVQRLEIEYEHRRADELLFNMLPSPVAERLKRGEAIADALTSVSVVFADIVEFTPRAAQLPPQQIIGALNTIFSHFDQLTQRHGMEKIKTIGDAYMAVAGGSTNGGDHAGAAAELALALRRASAELGETPLGPFTLRIGIHTGPAVAGVIGLSRVAYDLWGDTVNTASRMEAFGESDRIQITADTFALLEGRYRCELRGIISIKGKGDITTFWLLPPHPNPLPQAGEG